MRLFALVAIRGYKRFLSPYKGFHCAYCTLTGRATCSDFGHRAIARRGLLIGSLLLRRRLRRCANAADVLDQRRQRAPLSQRGDCDPGCDGGCDLGHASDCDLSFDSLHCSKYQPCSGISDCDFGSCDWPNRSRAKRRSPRKT